jgi:transposase InsO family protein
MTLTMYERIGHEGRRRSPLSWRIRYAPAHKGVEPQFRHVRFADVGAQALYIEPGSPWENSYCESFNRKLRDELLNSEIFYSLREAQFSSNNGATTIIRCGRIRP